MKHDWNTVKFPIYSNKETRMRELTFNFTIKLKLWGWVFVAMTFIGGMASTGYADDSYQTYCTKNSDGNYQPYAPLAGKFLGAVGAGSIERCNAYRATQRGAFVCSYTGEHFMPYSIRTGQRIGSQTSGAQTLERCAAYLAAADEEATCSYTGEHFMPYNSYGAILGSTTAGSATLERCNAYMSTRRGTFVCSYTGEHFMPYSTRTGQRIGSLTSGAETLERCAQYVATAQGHATCSYTGQYFMPYNSNGLVLGTTNGGAETLDRCAQYMATANGRLICSYNGNKFQIYDIRTGTTQPGGEFSYLENCGQVIRSAH
jgi:hypothetical protein